MFLLMLSKRFVGVRYHVISHFICPLSCWRWKAWKTWVIHNCQSRWFQLTSSNVIFLGANFHIFSICNIWFWHIQRIIVKKMTNWSDLQKNKIKIKIKLQLVTEGGQNIKEFLIFSTFILVYSQIWLKLLMYDHDLATSQF